LEEGHFEFYEEKFVIVEPTCNICVAVLEIEPLAKSVLEYFLGIGKFSLKTY